MRLSDSQKWLVLAVVLALGGLLYLLGPVLTPFLIAGLLAYLGDPAADRLEALGLSRTWAVIVVFSGMVTFFLVLLLVLAPLLERQIAILIKNIPVVVQWLESHLIPRIEAITGIEMAQLDIDAIRKTLLQHWREVGSAASNVLVGVTASGQAILAALVALGLIPIVTFYLLRDWDVLMANLRGLLPRQYEPKIVSLSRECDLVLAEFLRGQLLVMTCLGFIYTLGLWVIGLDLAVLIGILSGLVSFVPYMGFVVGILAAGIAALVQFHEWLPLLYVGLVYGAGQLIEGMLLSPLIVGDRIGLHPVAVIFAVMAGGQLFGFFGVLLALPVAAVIMVLLRHSHELYLTSSIYETKE
jgi:predicted PurR-regulated permease PerM